jgi:hypothetical protein
VVYEGAASDLNATPTEMMPLTRIVEAGYENSANDSSVRGCARCINLGELRRPMSAGGPAPIFFVVDNLGEDDPAMVPNLNVTIHETGRSVAR